MIVQDIITAIKAETAFVTNSLIIKSVDSDGLTFKFLNKQTVDGVTTAVRREVFVATEASFLPDPLARTVIEHIDVIPAS